MEKGPIVRESFLFEKAPFQSCHASTITETDSGDILCAFFAGTREGGSDVGIWLSHFNKESWANPKQIASHKGDSLLEPRFIYDAFRKNFSLL